MIAIAVLTHNRVHLLRQCVENVLRRTSELTTEIVIWDNASSDGTAEYLETVSDPRIRVVNHPKNIGQNGYARAFALMSAPYLVDLDDDMIDAPAEWDRALLESFEKLPQIGFLAASLVDNPHDQAARVMYHERAHEYTTEEVNGVVLLRGPVGGGCALTSRDLYDRVGGFRERPNEVFFLEDAAYIEHIAQLGFEAAYLKDVALLHAGGTYYARESHEKREYWRSHWRHELRKNAVKKALLKIPFVAPLNQRYGWFRVSEIPEAVRRAS